MLDFTWFFTISPFALFSILYNSYLHCFCRCIDSKEPVGPIWGHSVLITIRSYTVCQVPRPKAITIKHMLRNPSAKLPFQYYFTSLQRPWHEYEHNFQIMYRVGMGHKPPIPERISPEGKDFLSHCLESDPKMRWTASQLLDHSFVKVG